MYTLFDAIFFFFGGVVTVKKQKEKLLWGLFTRIDLDFSHVILLRDMLVCAFTISS